MRPFRERRERKINDQVAEVAGMTAAVLFDSLTEGETGPYHVPIGRKPNGIKREDYLERVQASTFSNLARIGLVDSVTYDPKKTETASTHQVPFGEHNTMLQWDDKNLELVFRQPAEELSSAA